MPEALKGALLLMHHFAESILGSSHSNNASLFDLGPFSNELPEVLALGLSREFNRIAFILLRYFASNIEV
jgi:hypothetical protein